MEKYVYKVVLILKDDFIISYQPFNKYVEALEFIIKKMTDDDFIKEGKIVNTTTKLVVLTMNKY